MAKEKICIPFFRAKYHSTITTTTRPVRLYPTWLHWTFLGFVLFVVIFTELTVTFKCSPQCPSLHITGLKINKLNFTKNPKDSSTRLTSNLNITISVQNPNKAATFIFDTLNFNVFSFGILLGNASFGDSFAQESQTSGVRHAWISNATTIYSKYHYYDDDDEVAFDVLVAKVYLRKEFYLKITGTADVRVMMGEKMIKQVEYKICCPRIKVIPDDLSGASTSWELPKGYGMECYTY